MQIMKSYADMLIEIEIIEDQIELVTKELKYWFGIDLDKEKGIPLGGSGSHKFGAQASLIQADKKIKTYHKLTEQLKELKFAKVRMDMLMEQFKGLDYKIAYKRIVESKTHQEIADDLGYSHQYIKERWLKIKTYTEHTEPIVKT
ncbi:hypothetical protein [Virgibacillus dokdonensis]|uniref:hypothetical protein n=1 Tax=Virgibacillus dokdonensis TaxID=302167 RepID=UPI00098AD3CF|nr:hypothetical protein [Virgibacillus dokdonensis]